MSIRHQRFARTDVDGDQNSVGKVDGLAAQLRRELEERASDIDLAHVHGASSSRVQKIVSAILLEHLGFREEVKLTPEDGVVSRPRPDFYLPLGDEMGIIAEVERGGTVTNNHDLKDVWKAHISRDTQHLFLIVPNANWDEAGRTRERPFVRVTHRVGAFFGDPRREIDIASCHIFGYGRDDLASPVDDAAQ